MPKPTGSDKWFHDFENVLLEVGDGWIDLVYALWKLCMDNNIEIEQVKEKFGGLRFYVGSTPEWIEVLIDAMEEYSFGICEVCGKSGEPRPGYWTKTLCDEHWEAIRPGSE